MNLFVFSLRLNQTYRQLLNDNESLTVDHKQLKSQLNEAKLEHTWLEADFSKLKKEFQQLDISSTKLTNQCEVLTVPQLPLEKITLKRLNEPTLIVQYVCVQPISVYYTLIYVLLYYISVFGQIGLLSLLLMKGQKKKKVMCQNIEYRKIGV